MTTVQRSRLKRRLLPLQAAAFLQGVGFWVPVEKLFMNEIGFDAASIGLMAAAYAAIVPVIEVPSGILADRWSRRGVLVLSSVALMVSALLGGLSHSVPMYFLSALALGVFFAMYSGTMDAVVYDTVLEETGDSDGFERQLGRVRLVNSAALVTSALAGGALAGLAGTRTTYLVTVPFVALSIVALLRFTEPQLHRATGTTSLSAHVALTCRTLTRGGRLLPVVTMAVLAALILQLLLEFGPLWLVAPAAPALLYGPYWAGLVSALGLGGLLAGKLDLDRPRTAAAVAVLMTAAGLTLTTSAHVLVVTGAQILLALLVVAASIHVSRLLHDAVPATVRTGVASGVSTLSWIAFLPVAIVFGLVSERHGVHTGGWMFVAVTVAAGLLVSAQAWRGARGTAPGCRPGT
ncbi:MFS family permease [Saccharothrix ecbatanensis]|uniref:MFS family permease n=1 Tax=Saccharothrix ecbatanensis TaxID=1105145 RepID=A0A7W9HE93_9PSEU|nr:MFS transporter [Saccharothrix ecbatanensis]MBB5800376.1 MFS family permease [Saccharothrix ecbatanensis]